jgi:hypothetical protein
VSPDPFAGLLGLPGVFEAVEGARAGIDGLLREPALRRRPPEITVEALRRGAWASAALEGVGIALADFEPPFPVAVTEQDRQVAAASLRLSTELGSVTGVWRRAPLQALARLHSVAAASVLDSDEVGRPRVDPQVSARLAALASALTAPTDAPAVLVAAVVHGELLATNAFVWGNGLVARAAQRLVLIDRGVDPAAVSVPEVGVLDAGRDAYDAALTGYASGTDDGRGQWLCFVAETVARGALAGRVAIAERTSPDQ